MPSIHLIPYLRTGLDNNDSGIIIKLNGGNPVSDPETSFRHPSAAEPSPWQCEKQGTGRLRGMAAGWWVKACR